MNSSTQIQVFVSCPSDVALEKSIVHEVCNRVNRILLNLNCHIHLIAREWSEVYGEIGVQPQDSINATFTEYDIYLGILWMRFGTPTKNVNPNTGNFYQSGTEEEFEIAFKKKEDSPETLRMNFFFKEPVATKTTAEHIQFGKVLEFKDRIQQLGMTNSFSDEHNFRVQITDLLTQIAVGNCMEKKTSAKNEILKAESTVTVTSVANQKIKETISLSYKNFDRLTYYIPRSLIKLGEDKGLNNLFPEYTYHNKLTHILLESSRIVLLGNAGIGKSVELQHFATDEKSPFISIYKRFNTYVNEDIENFLPSGWDLINSEILVILLDGLDEIQSQYFNTAIRKIQTFSDKYPDLKIVVSCRSNFYEVPTETYQGTLTGFDCYYLDDIKLSEIVKYVNNEIKLDGERFIEEVYSSGYMDIAVKPFFLNILISYFKKFGNLNTKKSEIIKESIVSRIKLDRHHFQTIGQEEKSKFEILDSLKLVALAMEMLGRNFITTDEIYKIVKNDSSFNSLKYFPSFNKVNDQDETWSFEHNNIQEFLAASVLAESSFEKIKQIISFPPEFTRVKPSWLNTLSFITNIGDDKLTSSLIDWLIETEPETIIKFERDRISKENRIGIFKKIFNHYTEKNIWLSSNKFTISELARFAQSEDAIEFLIEHLSSESSTSIIKLNALHLIENIDFLEYSNYYLTRIEIILFVLLENEKEDSHFVYSVLRSMAKLKLNSKEVIDKVLLLFGKRRNQYIRSGLYKLIGESDYVNDFIYVFLDGLQIIADNNSDDRDPVSLGDESWLLKEAFQKASSPNAIRQILNHFNDITGKRLLRFYEKKEVFKTLVENAIEAHEQEPAIYNDVLSMFSTSGKLYELEFANLLANFFTQTKTKESAFTQLWKNPSIASYEKDLLVSILIDSSIIDFFIDQFVNREYTNEDVLTFHRILLWYVKGSTKEFDALSYFEEKVKEKTQVVLNRPAFIDYEKLNQQKAQKNLDTLFDRMALVDEVEKIFIEYESTEISFDELWELRRKNIQDIDEHFLSCALNILRDFTRNQAKIDFETVKKWILSDRFNFYQIDEIRTTLKNNTKLTLTEQQIVYVQKWSEKIAQEIDWENITKRKSGSDEQFTINTAAELIWFFVDKLNISLDKEHLLSYTLFISYDDINSRTHGLLDKLEDILGTKDISNRVIKNIKNGISVSSVWKTNVLYAIDKNLKDVYLDIFENLTDDLKSEYSRIEVLDAIFKKTNNIAAIKELLTKTNNESIKWKCVEILMPLIQEYDFLINFLTKEMKVDSNQQPSKLIAAKYLTELNNIEGLAFYTDYLVNQKDPSLDYHELAFFTKITSLEALPNLLKLLFLAKQPEFQKDRFNSLESIVLTVLTNLGVISDDNLEAVKKALISFIEENKTKIPDINFLYNTVDRMEYQYYTTKSKSYNINDVIDLIRIVEL